MSLFARPLCRAARPAWSSARRYATEGGPNAGASGWTTTSRTIVAAGTVTAVLVGYELLNRKSNTVKLASVAHDNVAASGHKAFVGGDQGWVSLKLEAVDDINHNTRRLRFALPEPGDISGLDVASAILTKYQGPGMEKPVIRPYTPVSDDGAVGYLDLLVKSYPGGPMSTHLHEMRPEQRLDFKGPVPKYPLQPNQHSQVALIAGGTGITPMWQVARAIFQNPADQTKVTLIFGNNTEEDILLKEELQQLENTYPNRFKAFYVVSNPSEKWQGPKGYISKDLLKTVLPEPKEENIKVFVCGPPGLYRAISGMKNSPKDQGDLTGLLKDLGYSKDQVFKF